MLTRIYCHNYKCLDNFEFRPAATQLLMGRNGGGKSTVFEVLALLRDFAARGEDCEHRFLGKTRTRWQTVDTQRFELDVTGNGGSYTYELLVDDAGKPPTLHIKRERLSYDGNPLYLFEDGVVHLHDDQFADGSQFSIIPRRSYLSEMEPRPENTKLMWFKGWLNRVSCIQIDPKRMAAVATREAVYPSDDLSNFAEWYRHLRQENGAATDDLRGSLRNVIDGFDSLDLSGPPTGAKDLKVVVAKGLGEGRPKPESRIARSLYYRNYGFDELSDGQRTLIGLYALLHCALTDDSTLCIDEPDNFIALSEIQPWLFQLIDQAQETNSQILTASHHPELLNQLATRNGVIIEREDGGPTRVRPYAPPGDTTLTPAEIVARGWEHA